MRDDTTTQRQTGHLREFLIFKEVCLCVCLSLMLSESKVLLRLQRRVLLCSHFLHAGQSGWTFQTNFKYCDLSTCKHRVFTLQHHHPADTHYLNDLFICGPALHRLRHIRDRSICPNGDDLYRHSDRSSGEDCRVEDLRILEGNTARSMLMRTTEGLTGRLITELMPWS